MVLKLPGHLATNETGKDNLSQAQIPFKERAFCLVGDEIKAKMEALGLTIKDLETIFSKENENAQYLEVIDLYFPQLQEIKKYLDEKYILQYHDYDGDDKDEIIRSTSVNNLKYVIVSFEEIKTIFGYKGDAALDVIKIYNHGRIADFSKFIKYVQENRLSFDWADAVRFFSIENNTTIGEENIIAKLYGAHDRLRKYLRDEFLFQKVLKMAASTNEHTTIHFLHLLQSLPENEIQQIEKNYDVIMHLSLLAERNVYDFYRSGTRKMKMFEEKGADEIIDGFDVLGSDFVYVYQSDSWFIGNMQQIFPHQFSLVCTHLQNIASHVGNKEIFYMMCLTSIADFLSDNPDEWIFLEEIAEMFGKYTPAILGEGMTFIDKLCYKNYQERYAILKQIHEISQDVSPDSRALFLSHGLRFFGQMYLVYDIKTIITMMKEMQQLSNTHLADHNNSVFYSYSMGGERTGLNILYQYLSYFPNEYSIGLEKILTLISKHTPVGVKSSEVTWDRYFLGMQSLIDQKILSYDPHILKDIISYFDKVGSRKSDIDYVERCKDYYFDMSIFNGDFFDEKQKRVVEKINQSRETISYALSFLLRHKKSKVMPFLKNLHMMKDLSIEIDLASVFLSGASLEYANTQYLEYLFEAQTMQQTRIWKYFLKLGGQEHHNASDMAQRISSISSKQSKNLSKKHILPTLRKIQNVFADLVLKYFEEVLKRKIHIKFKSEFTLAKDFPNHLISSNVVEFYKMYRGSNINQKQAKEFLELYFKEGTYTGKENIENTYPYNRKENQDFLLKVFGGKTGVRLSRREKVYEVRPEDSENFEISSDQLEHHMKVAIEKIRLMGEKNIPGGVGELIQLFDTKIKKQRSIYDETLYADLELQVKSIKHILQSTQAKQLKQVKIYHELDPLKIAMMGNWVDGSCLSYYNSVGNYWSAITNALEVNKGVFYFEDEKGTIIARILVGVDEEGNLEVHPIYMKGILATNIKPYFVDYIQSLAADLGKNLQGNRKKVTLLFCDNWYSGD